jgi:hypothetical protein
MSATPSKEVTTVQVAGVSFQFYTLEEVRMVTLSWIGFYQSLIC